MIDTLGRWATDLLSFVEPEDLHRLLIEQGIRELETTGESLEPSGGMEHKRRQAAAVIEDRFRLTVRDFFRTLLREVSAEILCELLARSRRVASTRALPDTEELKEPSTLLELALAEPPDPQVLAQVLAGALSPEDLEETARLLEEEARPQSVSSESGG